MFKHELHEPAPQARVFYISRVFSNVRIVLLQCNARLTVLHFLYDIEVHVMRRQTNEHAFSMFYTMFYTAKTWVFDQSEPAQVLSIL